MKTLKEYTKIYIGSNNDERIYLSPPSWDCGWYWGFGYIGNRNCHYHVDGLKKIETYNFENNTREYEFVNLYDGFKKHFGNSFIVRDSQIWTLAELFQTFYDLRNTVEVLGRGGSHLTTNPCKDIIINTKEVERINSIVLPAIFDEIYKIFDANKNNKSLFDRLVKLNLKGDTSKVIEFMKANNIKTDDLKSIDGISKETDYDVIHTYYWKDYHANKNKKDGK